MSSFITGTELEVIRDGEEWDPHENVTIREYSQMQKEKMEAQIVQMSGPPGAMPSVITLGDLVPVLEAGIEAWTFRELSENELLRLYETHAKKLSKDVDSLSTEEKCEAIKDVPIVPVTREWMGKLKPSYATFIAREIRRLNRGRTTAAERDFLRQIGADHLIEAEAAARDNAD